jgi:hypothetical protein
LANKNKKKADTVKVMEKLDGCALRANGGLDDTKCFAGVKSFKQEADDIKKYWDTMVYSTGGAASTTNSLEKLN